MKKSNKIVVGVAVTTFSLSAMAVVLLGGIGSANTEPNDLGKMNRLPAEQHSPGVDRVDKNGLTFGHVRFEDQKMVVPDFVAVNFHGKTGYVAKGEVFAGPAFFPDGSPTGEPTEMIVLDADGKQIGVMEHVVAHQLGSTIPEPSQVP